MLSPALLSVLLAQAPEAQEAATKAAEAAAEGSSLRVIGIFLTVLAVLILPFIFGNFLANSMRMPEFGPRIGVVLFALIAGGLVVGFGWPPKLGVDLKGGVILTYEVADDDADINALIEALGRRINPSGTKEIVIRPYGSQQVEIIIPEVDPIEVKRIQAQIEQTGVLEFRIVANDRDHDYIIEAAKEQAKKANPSVRLDRTVQDENEKKIGRWVGVGRERVKVGGVVPFKIQRLGMYTLRDGATGKLLDDPSMPRTTEDQAMEKWLSDAGVSTVQVLVAIDDGFDVTGDYLSMASSSFDERAKPCVKFNMSPRGGTLFGAFTNANRPTDNFSRQLGIVLDNTLQSAPDLNEPISTSGQITGSFTTEEVDSLVNILRAGKLPSSLLGPTSNNQVGSLLGADTINKGTKAISISLIVVLVFIAFYYRFAGVVACLALLMNLLLILAVLILFKQPLTLPGLAGLVLTVGMSVDANVLIFERIREEINKGAALRMAIRNGFGRATTTIVDANVTTLITAIVLYAIGTDQIKGFAVTLIVGILMSMFTAIFCSRVIFELAERKRWITQLNMMEILKDVNFDFIGKRKIAAAISCVLILIGLGAVILRGSQIFDIDFRGGTAVTMMLDESMDDKAVREKLDSVLENEKVGNSSIQFNLSNVSVEGQEDNRFWKVNTSIEDVDRLKNLLKDNFPLATHSMNIVGDLEEKLVGTSTPKSEPKDDPKSEPKDDPKSEPKDDPKSEPKDDPKSEPKDDPKSEPKDDPKPEPKDDPKTEPKDDPKPEPKDDPKSEPKDDPKSEPKDDPKPEPKDDPKTEPKDDPKTEPKDDPKPEPKDDPKPEPKDDPKPEPKDDPKPEPKESPEPPKESDNAFFQSQAGDLLAYSNEAAAAMTLLVGQDKAGDDTEAPAPDVTTDDAPPAEDTTAEALGDDQFYETTAQIEFSTKLNYATLKDRIESTAAAMKINVIVDLVVNEPADKWTRESPKPYNKWTVTLNTDAATTSRVLNTMQEAMSNEPVWHAADKIGAQVAGKTQSLAVWALLSSLLGIVAYIWIRFQKVVFGLAAVVALVHDVLITLGAIAVSFWLAGSLGFLQIEEFKISLPVVAAFLTIIGYSLNDTIVVFDRIREVRGKTPELTEEMINTSINQTLGRTLLTSVTTLLVVGILYAGGGQSIHGFSYALLVGVLVGTYSSIFVASPALLWMMKRTVASSR